MYKQDVQDCGLDGETKEVLVRAIEKIGTLDLPDSHKQAVTDDVERIQKEITKDKPDAGLVKKIWHRIEALAPTVAAGLECAAAIAQLMKG